MSVICVICHGPLFQPSGEILPGLPGSNGGLQIHTDQTLSSPCGHLLHNSCLRELEEWIRAKESRKNFANCCPHCQKNVGSFGFIKIFPTYPKQKSKNGSVTSDDFRDDASRTPFYDLKSSAKFLATGVSGLKLDTNRSNERDDVSPAKSIDEELNQRRRRVEDVRRIEEQKKEDNRKQNWEQQQDYLEFIFEREKRDLELKEEYARRTYDQHKASHEQLRKSKFDKLKLNFEDLKRESETANKDLENKKHSYETQQLSALRQQEWNRTIKDYEDKRKQLERQQKDLDDRQRHINTELEQGQRNLDVERESIEEEFKQKHKELEKLREDIFEHLKSKP